MLYLYVQMNVKMSELGCVEKLVSKTSSKSLFTAIIFQITSYINSTLRNLILTVAVKDLVVDVVEVHVVEDYYQPNH